MTDILKVRGAAAATDVTTDFIYIGGILLKIRHTRIVNNNN